MDIFKYELELLDFGGYLSILLGVWECGTVAAGSESGSQLQMGGLAASGWSFNRKWAELTSRGFWLVYLGSSVL